MTNAEISNELMLISQRIRKKMKEAEIKGTNKQVTKKESPDEIGVRCLFTGKAAAYLEALNCIDSLRGRI